MSHASIARNLRRELSPDWNTVGPFQWGKVASVSAGTVDLYLDGATGLTTGIPCLESYSPQVGDVTMVARMQGAAQAARVALGPLAPVLGWQAPTLGNGWANVGAPNLGAGYRLEGDVVRLRGAIYGGTGSPFTLPAGYRPTGLITVPIAANLAASPYVTPGIMQILAAGTFAIYTGVAASQIELDGVTFTVD